MKRQLKYTYHIDLDERGYFIAHVENSRGRRVWYVDYPRYFCYSCENSSDSCRCEDGAEDLREDSTIFEDGFMRHNEDIKGLGEYLRQLGFMPKHAELVRGEDN